MRNTRVKPAWRTLIACALGTVLGLSLTYEALAGAPIRARRMLMHVTTAYDACTVTDTTSDSTGGAACLAPVQSDAFCKFDTRGRGKLKLTSRPDNVRWLTSLKGIDGACEGETLEILVSLRITSDDCGGQACTLPDLIDTVVGQCVIQNNTCISSGTLNAAISNIIVENKETFIKILGCGLRRSTGPNLPTATFACGLMIP